jgi:mannose-6-phosphate isomerase
MSILVENGVFRLFGKIQHYSWGGYSFLPALLGLQPKPDTPYAEYWMGAHEKLPSEILQSDGATLALDRLIQDQSDKILGSHVAQRYGRLPYLFKILDVREMLSIQVHPNKAEAEIGFAQENMLGIPLTAPERNYKDNNHKPELQLALSDFWLLHAFRPEDQILKVLNEVPEFHSLIPVFAHGGYRGLYKHLMEMPSKQVASLLLPLEQRILQQYEVGMLEKTSPDYWAAKAIKDRSEDAYDRGIFSIYLFNLIKLEPGSAIFQDAGIPHADLEGQAIEIMANSDNVIRGGLTPKHVDVPQLLKLTTFQGITPTIVEGKEESTPHEFFYRSPGRDFGISKIVLKKGERYENISYSTEIMLLYSGESMFATLDKDIGVKKGESILIPAQKNYRLQALSDEVVIFKAFIPTL